MLLLDPEQWPHVTFVVYQREVGEQGTEHFQGYMELDTQVAYTTLHTYEGLETAHFEQRRGTQKQAIDYCTKPNAAFPDDETKVEGHWTYGEPKHQGQRVDLEEMRRDLDAGHRLAVVAREHFPVWIKYPSAVKSYQALQAKDRTEPPAVFILLGTTGCGKSRLARQMFPDAYWKPNFDYWENYQYEDAVVLDEFYGHKMQYTDLLQLLDSTPLLVNVKGASAKMNSTVIIFTSNQHPRYWYKAETITKHCEGGWDSSPLKRRLDEFATFIMLTPVPDGPVLVEPEAPRFFGRNETH